MRRLSAFVIAAILVLLYTGCQPAANSTTPNTTANANTNAAKPAAAAPPTTDALMAIDTKAWEAYKNRDGKFFEGFISDNFVGFGSDGKRPTRAEVIKMISEHKCEFKNYALSDAKMTPAGADVAVLTYKATAEGTCEGKPIPSPVTASTVFVRSGDTWKAAYHNEVAITDPKNMKAPPPAPPKKEAKSANANSETAETVETASDALTAALVAAEKTGWEAWKAKDAKKMEEVTAKDLTFVDIFGNVRSGQADIIKHWMEDKCEVKAVDVTDAKGSSLNATTAILTYKGHAEGTCGGQPLHDLWGTTVAIKDGDKWRAVYIFETPMM